MTRQVLRRNELLAKKEGTKVLYTVNSDGNRKKRRTLKKALNSKRRGAHNTNKQTYNRGVKKDVRTDKARIGESTGN